VRVEVQEPPRVHERGSSFQVLLHHGAGPVGGLVACFDLSAQPLVQVLRDVLQEQRDARRGLLESLDPAAHLRSAAPVGNSPFDVGQFLGQVRRVGQHPPVVYQGEALVFRPEYPVRRHGVHGEFSPGPEARPTDGADAVVAEDGQLEQIRRGPDVLRSHLHVGEGHQLHEDRGFGDLHQGRLPADAGSDRHGRVHELAQGAITAQGQGCGDGAMGAETRTARHVRNFHCCLHLGTYLNPALAPGHRRAATALDTQPCGLAFGAG
jgi:hypothetical protein